MNLITLRAPLANSLQDLPLAIAISEGEALFPWIETVHVVAITLVIGSIFLVDFRLTGIAFKQFDLASFAGVLTRFTWAGFVLAAMSGSLLFISNASTYLQNTAFQTKFVFMLLAGVNMLIFQFIFAKNIRGWGVSYGKTPLPAKLAGYSSLVFWMTVVACGRWIGFTL